MKLAPLAAVAAICLAVSSTTAAAQRQPDGTYRFGEAIMRERLPLPAQQRAQCRSVGTQLLGVLGMNFVGPEPWLGHHPMLERNCVMLVDLEPITHAPFAAELMAAERSLWSVVLRFTMPPNPFHRGQALGFAWCADQTCARNVFLVFVGQQLVGFCSARPGPNAVTRYALTNIGDSRAFTALGPYRSCFEEVRKSVEMIAAVQRMPDVEVLVPPSREQIVQSGQRDDERLYQQRQAQAGQEQQARRQAELDAERRAAEAAWRRLQTPNQLGW